MKFDRRGRAAGAAARFGQLAGFSLAEAARVR
jgi:hypothetical protein